MAKIFNEQELRKEIALKWGEYGSHVEVLDRLIKENKELKQKVKNTLFTPDNVYDVYKQATPEYFNRWLKSQIK